MTTEKLRSRVVSVDLLRGIIMVIMALDHVRDFFSNSPINPTDLENTTAALFFTRWISHFCAPVFVFLAGTAAYLSLAGGKSKKELSWFLFTRGLWLIFLELTVIRIGWFFNVDFSFFMLQVIWALGWAMLFLAALVYLPVRITAVIGLIMIMTHNLFDQVQIVPEWSSILTILHQPGVIPLRDLSVFFVAYPLIPWIGVMGVGYSFGRVMVQPDEIRRKNLWRTGLLFIVVFVVLRYLNIYGDPAPWSVQKDALFTALSFINCTKYPPSLLYLLMTLGPGILLLAVFDRKLPVLMKPMVVFGKVPMFYYLLHVYIIHGLAVLMASLKYEQVEFLMRNPTAGEFFPGRPAGYGYELPGVYLAWLVVLLILYPLCYWFARVKARNREVKWLSYL